MASSIKLFVSILLLSMISHSASAQLGKLLEKKKNGTPGSKSGLEDAKLTASEQKYAGHIVFSSAPIRGHDLDESKLKTTFKQGEPVYAHVILTNYFGKLMNMYKKDITAARERNEPNRPTMYARVDGNDRAEFNSSTTPIDGLTVDGYTGDFVAMESRDKWLPKFRDLNDWLERRIGALPAGKHTVTIEFVFDGYDDFKVNASDSFTVIVSGEAFATGKKWSDFKSNNDDAGAVKDILFIGKKYWPSETIVDGSIDNWTIHRDDVNIPLYRTAWARIYIKRDKKCFVRSFIYKQDYAGVSGYNNTGRSVGADIYKADTNDYDGGNKDYRDDPVDCK